MSNAIDPNEVAAAAGVAAGPASPDAKPQEAPDPAADGRADSGEPGAISQETPDPSALDADPLYEYRKAMVFDEPEPEAQPSRPNRLPVGAALLAALALILVLGFGLRLLRKSQPVILADDLGTRRSDSAGVGGQLIAQWKDGASYRLVIDPLDPAELPAFEAMAGDLPHAVIFAIALRDSSGGVVCQRQIVLTSSSAPGSAGQAQDTAVSAASSGDSAQGVTGKDGKIDELVLSGPLPCRLEAFQRIAGWDFATDFPPLSQQAASLEKKSAVSRAKSPSGGGLLVPAKLLPAPIEGDDAIVSDNPSRGLVSTGGGRTFLVGANLGQKSVFGWKSFPTPIHYRCEKNGTCALTSTVSGTIISARLMR